MNCRPVFGLGLALFAVLSPAWASESSMDAIDITSPRLVLSDEGKAFGLLTLHNRSSQTEQLTHVRGNGVTLMHNVEVGDAMRLVPVDRLAVPRGKTLTFTTDALHLVFENSSDLSAGDTVTTVFVFEPSGDVEVVFVVEASEPPQAHAARD